MVVGSQSAIFGQQVRNKHLFYGRFVTANPVAGLAVGVVLLRTAAQPFDLLQLLVQDPGCPDAGQPNRHLPAGVDGMVDLNRPILRYNIDHVVVEPGLVCVAEQGNLMHMHFNLTVGFTVVESFK